MGNIKVLEYCYHVFGVNSKGGEVTYIANSVAVKDGVLELSLNNRIVFASKEWVEVAEIPMPALEQKV